MAKKLFAVVLAAAMVLGLVSTAFAAGNPVFLDTAGVPEEADIAFLKTLGIVEGYQGYFRPLDPVTRAEVSKMIVAMLNLKSAAGLLNTPTIFSDVTADHSWAYGYINVAVANKIVKGYGNGLFGPNDYVTQAQVLTMVLRALGYDDDLPGEWPVDYLMQGAILGLAKEGFNPNLPATRAQVAAMVRAALDAETVTEGAEHNGVFAGTGKTLYFKKFGFSDTDVAKVTGYVKYENETYKVDTVNLDAASDVVIYGKASLSELVGQRVVVYRRASDDKAIYIQVVTPGEIIGKVTAVDTVNGTVTVAGVVYTVKTDAEVLKNGATLEGALAGKLVAIKDAEVTMIKDTDGKIRRISANIANETGTLTGKTITQQLGKLVYEVTIGAQTYQLADGCTIIRNGVAATFADLKTNDDLLYARDGSGKITYLNAYAQKLEGYKLESISWSSTGRSLVVSKSGVTSTFVVNEDDFTGTLTLGSTYNLILDRDGKVIGVEDYISNPTTDGTVKKIVGKAGDTSTLKLLLNDGTELVFATKVSGSWVLAYDAVYVAGQPQSGTAEAQWYAVPIDALVKVVDDSDDAETKPDALKVYPASVSGYVYSANNTDKTIQVKDADNKLYNLALAYSSTVTLNGKTVYRDDAVAHLASNNGTAVKCTVTLDGSETSNGTPVAATLVAEDLTDMPTAVVVTEIRQSGTTYTYVYRAVYEGTEGTVTLDSKAVLMKNGAAITRADVVIGNKIQVAQSKTLASSETTPVYVKVSDDTKAPVVGDVSAVFGNGTVTVTVYTNEVPATAYLWVGGTKYTVTDPSAFRGYAATKVISDTTCYKWTITYSNSGFSASSVLNGVQLVDFAGNISSYVAAQ